MHKATMAILWSLLLVVPGCSVEPMRAVIVESRRLEGRPGITLLDPNDELYSATIAAGGSSWWGETSGGIKGGNNCRVSYDPSYAENLWMVVEGRLSNGRKYPAVLDTGASVGLCVNDIHVLENKLAVYPFESGGESTGWGVCNLPDVEIGGISLSKWPCIYRGQHAEIQVFGLPVCSRYGNSNILISTA